MTYEEIMALPKEDSQFKSDWLDGYQQGRAEAEAEHLAMCENCIHKVSADDIEQIRADAIEEFWKEFDKQIKLKGRQSYYYTEFLRIGMNIKEQLKEQKNEKG